MRPVNGSCLTPPPPNKKKKKRKRKVPRPPGSPHFMTYHREKLTLKLQKDEDLTFKTTKRIQVASQKNTLAHLAHLAHLPERLLAACLLHGLLGRAVQGRETLPVLRSGRGMGHPRGTGPSTANRFTTSQYFKCMMGKPRQTLQTS